MTVTDLWFHFHLSYFQSLLCSVFNNNVLHRTKGMSDKIKKETETYHSSFFYELVKETNMK